MTTSAGAWTLPTGYRARAPRPRSTPCPWTHTRRRAPRNSSPWARRRSSKHPSCSHPPIPRYTSSSGLSTGRIRCNGSRPAPRKLLALALDAGVAHPAVVRLAFASALRFRTTHALRLLHLAGFLVALRRGIERFLLDVVLVHVLLQALVVLARARVAAFAHLAALAALLLLLRLPLLLGLALV